MMSRPANFRALDIAEIRRALPAGLLLSLIITYVLTTLSLSPMILAVACCIAGTTCGVLGLGVMKLFRYVKGFV
jgi:hypothetical protein